MEHKGLRYEVLQMTHPSGLEVDRAPNVIKTQTGFCRSKDVALFCGDASH